MRVMVTYDVGVVVRIEEIDMPLQSHLQALRRMTKQLQNLNDTAQNEFATISSPSLICSGYLQTAMKELATVGQSLMSTKSRPPNVLEILFLAPN